MSVKRKPLSNEQIERKREYARKYYSANPEKYRDNYRKWAIANPEKVRVAVRKWASANPKKKREASRKYMTGFTSDMFAVKLAEQGNVCAICRRTFSEKLRPYADHCHNTKTPRGILCLNCNTAEGHILKSGMGPRQFGEALEAYCGGTNDR